MTPPSVIHRAARSAFGRTAHAVVALSVWAAPAIALAQAVPPPEPRVTRTYPVWLGYAIGAVLVGIIVLVSLMPSKRAHTD